MIYKSVIWIIFRVDSLRDRILNQITDNALYLWDSRKGEEKSPSEKLSEFWKEPEFDYERAQQMAGLMIQLPAHRELKRQFNDEAHKILHVAR